MIHTNGANLYKPLKMKLVEMSAEPMSVEVLQKYNNLPISSYKTISNCQTNISLSKVTAGETSPFNVKISSTET